jgi:hypothetical protein
MVVNIEFEMLWEEVVAALFGVLSQYLPGVTGKNYENSLVGIQVDTTRIRSRNGAHSIAVFGHELYYRCLKSNSKHAGRRKIS